MAPVIFLVKEMDSKTLALAWVYTAKDRFDSRAAEWSCRARAGCPQAGWDR